MQRIISLARTITSVTTSLTNRNLSGSPTYFTNLINSFTMKKLLQPNLPILNQVCGMKVKGRVRRRCKSCYIVFREERVYVMCHKFPRHKQMSMKPKPHNTWILTAGSQSPVRPW